jgi:hypothetical protein
MQIKIVRGTLLGTLVCLFVLFPGQTIEATMPVPVELVTGCVKDGQVSIQAPDRFKREKPLKINPCTNIPFDFEGSEGKQIRATGGIDLYNGAFVCPRDVVIIGDCSPGVCNPEFPCDSTPCGRENSESVMVPPDFEITYTSGPLHADWGGGLTITAGANGRVTEKRQGRPERRGMRPDEKVNTYTISQNDVKRLYALVVACHFFDLKDRYWNQKIMDGGSSSLRVTFGGKTQAVTTYYYTVVRFNRIADLF